ncbi:MAG TPA: ribosome maturation factor RimM [Caulobacteraceae bacterium]|nr:ribosome maturation factor RimM [Caulobacteraceae bacterium]
MSLSDDRLILVGRVAGAFGVKGDVRITTYTEDPLALAAYRDLKREDGSPGLTLLSARPAKGGLVGRAEEIETREEAEALRGLRLYIPRDVLPEPDEDEFYLADLIGLEARDGAGAVIGRIKSVQDFGAGDLLEIAPSEGGPTWWLPFTREAVPEVRLGDGYVVAVRPVETE